MPIDQQLDQVSNSIFKFILWLLPTSVLSNCASAYFYTKEKVGSIYAQLVKLSTAITNSFESPMLAFFKYNHYYVPMRIDGDTKYSSIPTWIYNIDTKEFMIPNTEAIHMRSFRLPFLSASLLYKKDGVETILGDLSEWLGEQTVYAPDGLVPLQVLVAAWMYTKEPPTLLMSYEHLYLKTMNDMAEEFTYIVETETEVEEGEVIHAVQ